MGKNKKKNPNEPEMLELSSSDEEEAPKTPKNDKNTKTPKKDKNMKTPQPLPSCTEGGANNSNDYVKPESDSGGNADDEDYCKKVQCQYPSAKDRTE